MEWRIRFSGDSCFDLGFTDLVAAYDAIEPKWYA
jgi:hypothetical protein